MEEITLTYETQYGNIPLIIVFDYEEETECTSDYGSEKVTEKIGADVLLQKIWAIKNGRKIEFNLENFERLEKRGGRRTKGHPLYKLVYNACFNQISVPYF